MDRFFQLVLLVITISLGVSARLNILGWFFFVGIISIALLGYFHFKTHLTRMTALEGKGHVLKIFLSHILFLCLFLFQVDYGSDRGYIVLENLLKIQPTGWTEISWALWVLSGMLYFYVTLKISNLPEHEKERSFNDETLLISVIALVILTFTLTIAL